jgi:putative ABC transport system permease protein
MLTSLRLRLRRLLERDRIDRELDEELGFHVAMSEREYMRGGMSQEDAHRRALLELGGADRFGEEYRDATGVRLLEDVGQDMTYAVRSLRRTPAFTVLVLLTLGVGIGAATMMFSLVDAVLLRPLPFESAREIVRVWQTDRTSETIREASAVPDYFDYVERARAFSAVAAHVEQARNLASPEGAERVAVLSATYNLLPLLGVPLVIGRGIAAAEDVPGGARVVLLTESFWRSHYGADASVIGSSIVLDDAAHEVIGITRDGHEYPHRGVDLIVPLAMSSASMPRYTHILDVTARLAPGVTLEAARRDMDRLMAELESEHPQSNAARGAFIEPVGDVLFGNVRAPLLILLAGVLLLLVTACANIANLLIARGAGRRSEFAVRAALGAGQARLTRQLIVESVTLTMACGVFGAFIAWTGLRVIVAAVGEFVPRAEHASFDLRAFGFAFAACVLTGLVFGLAPAGSARADVAALRYDAARGGGAPRLLLRRGLVVAQVALSVLLLAVAGLLLRSFVAVTRVDPGFDASRVVKAEYQLPESRYPRSFDNYPDWPEVQRFVADARRAALAIPGVSAAALSAQHPLAQGFTNSFVIIGREAEADDQPEIAVRAISPGYEETVGLRVVAGRLFDDRDHAHAPTVIAINQAAAHRFFPGANPVGQSIRYWGVERRIVGVVEDEHFAGLTRKPPPAAYSPLAQTPMHGGVLLVRTGRDPAAVIADVRTTLRAVDPQLALFGLEPLERTLSESIARERFTAVLLSLFATGALLLTTVGVHGLIAYTFVQRRRELGIRAALGAQPAALRSLFLREGITLALAGVTIGLAAALAVSSALRTLLFDVEPRDPLTYAVVAILMIAVSVTACWLPARRAGRISPLVTMRG